MPSKACPPDTAREMRALLRRHGPGAAVDWARVIELAAASGGTALRATVGSRKSRAIHIAAGAGEVSAVRGLLATGEDRHARRADGYTPMHVAAMSGCVKVMALLFRRGADPESIAHDPESGANIGNGFTPLIAAAAAGHVSAVAWLLDRAHVSVDSESSILVHDDTALMEASWRGYDHIVSLLIEKGADVNYFRYDDGETALSLAAGHGQNVVVQLLLDNGANANDVNHVDGFTALHHAVSGGHSGVIHSLVASRGNIRFPARNGETPLSLTHLSPLLRNCVLSARVDPDKKYVEPVYRTPTHRFTPRKASSRGSRR